MDDSKDTSAGKGLFSFLSDKDGAEKSGRSVSDVWETSQYEGSSSSFRTTRPAGTQRGKRFLNPVLVGAQPSPVVSRDRTSSSSLQRRGTTAEKIQHVQKSLATLDEVVSTTPQLPHPPGSLLTKSVLKANEATPPSHSPLATPAREPETPKAYLSIMDETGITRQLFMAPTPSRDVVTPPDTTRAMTLLEETMLREPDTTTLDEPSQKTGRDLVTLFHTAVSTYPNSADVLELAQALEKCCEVQVNQLKEVEEQSKVTLFPRMLTDLNLERSTWQLIHALYQDRVESESQEDMVVELLPNDRSDNEIVKEYFLKDSTVRQAQVVVDWLERNAMTNLEHYPVKVNYFADSVLWENTLHDIQHDIGKGHIVTELDPDAPTRQNRHLSELDSKDEQSLVKHLFACIRAGENSKAQELCLQCGQPWRAASLEGWKMYHDPNIGKSIFDELDVIEGNSGRNLWKISAWELTNDPGLSVYEKAIYAALSGNLRHLLPACQSWYDFVWAYFKVMVDVLTEQKLREYSHNDSRSLEDLPADYWNAVVFPEVIFQDIEACPSPLIKRQCQNYFHVVQKFIILDDLEGVVSVMCEWLEERPTLYHLRFMAHMVLFVSSLKAPVEEDKCAEILEAYVKGLIQEQYRSLVALYTVRLPLPLQVTCYAQLLEGVQDVEEQRACLEIGKEAGLNTAEITKAVVENVRNIGMDETLDTTALQLGKEVEITKGDWSKIQVINWLVFEESQRAEAIRQGNALIRAFLAMRKHSAAREVFKRIPPNSIEVVTRHWQMKAGDSPLPADLDDVVREYHCIQAYLDANDAFSEWFQHIHSRRPDPPSQPTGGVFKDQVAYEHKLKQYQMEGERWRRQLELLTADAETKIYNVLLFVGGGWMVEDPDISPVDSVRSNQLILLRHLCLPRMCFLLHTVLHSTEQYRKCLGLADIVSSEKYKLHKEFRQDELQKLLTLLQTSALEMVDDQHHDELGYDIA